MNYFWQFILCACFRFLRKSGCSSLVYHYKETVFHTFQITFSAHCWTTHKPPSWADFNFFLCLEIWQTHASNYSYCLIFLFGFFFTFTVTFYQRPWIWFQHAYYFLKFAIYFLFLLLGRSSCFKLNPLLTNFNLLFINFLKLQFRKYVSTGIFFESSLIIKKILFQQITAISSQHNTQELMHFIGISVRRFRRWYFKNRKWGIGLDSRKFLSMHFNLISSFCLDMLYILISNLMRVTFISDCLHCFCDVSLLFLTGCFSMDADGRCSVVHTFSSNFSQRRGFQKTLLCYLLGYVYQIRCYRFLLFEYFLSRVGF